ncbi:hypothetical protein [Paraburkholderia caribensis]|uniref:hypothetical protein n=1 Tax=Paraburkholderia caribensis TaxID=75105 RepID=UPI0020911F04|nr:hypothetical protein [Paraburkholderia caribensis]MCO4880226.1 hypothetical protein [Paraburkholderia caribensis]
MIELTSNQARTTLALALPAAGVGSNTATVTSGSGALFPQPGTTNYPKNAKTFFRFSITDAVDQTKHEICYCTTRNGDVLTLSRGQDGTVAQDWNAGDICGVFVVAGTVQNVVQNEQAQSGYLTFAVSTGTPNALIANIDPFLLESLTPGIQVEIQTNATNTGPVTLNLGGLGAIQVINKKGLPLVGSELLGGVIYRFVFSGTQWVVDSGFQPELYLQDTSAAVNVIQVTSGLGISAPGRALTMYVRVAQTNTAAVTMKLDGVSGYPVFSREGANFNPGVVKAGNTIRLVFDGQAWISDIANQSDVQIGEMKMFYGAIADVPRLFGPGWQVCDGTNGTPDMRDSFPIGAGGKYAVGSKGGSATTTLVTDNLPAHDHPTIDNGHVHPTVDNGHTHPTVDNGHVHGLPQTPHGHPVQDGGHAHTQGRGGGAQAGEDNGGAISSSPPNYPIHQNPIGTEVATSNISIAGAYANIGINPAVTGVQVNTARTNVSIASATTGVRVGTTGKATPVSILPQFVSVLFIMFVGP